jgi:hypothetical protein
MDFLLILVAIGGFVVAIVMLVLASRVNRLQKESDERVETLEAMATGSVLFAHTAEADPVFEPAMELGAATDLGLALNEFADEDEEEAPASHGVTAAAYPFVMTVPAAAGMGRMQVSFDRSRNRSRP